jgi:hypothetical protein
MKKGRRISGKIRRKEKEGIGGGQRKKRTSRNRSESERRVGGECKVGEEEGEGRYTRKIQTRKTGITGTRTRRMKTNKGRQDEKEEGNKTKSYCFCVISIHVLIKNDVTKLIIPDDSDPTGITLTFLQLRDVNYTASQTYTFKITELTDLHHATSSTKGGLSF